MFKVETTHKNPTVLILDLDSTLVHTSGNMNDYESLKISSNPKHAELRGRTYVFALTDVIDTPGTGSTTPMWGVLRPHMYEFLTFALSYFDDVKVWSAGQFKYVHAITDIVFDGLPMPRDIRTYDDCKKTANRIYKPLATYFPGGKDTIVSTCSAVGGCDLGNYLILDDREDTFELNPGNGVKIPVYEPKAEYGAIMKEDIALLQFRAWLSLPTVRGAHNLCSLDKSKIFTTSLSEYSSMLNGVPIESKVVEPNPFRSGFLFNLSDKTLI